MPIWVAWCWATGSRIEAYPAAAGDRDILAGNLERPRPDLEPLQVEQDRYPAADAAARLAHPDDQRPLPLVIAVGGIDANDIRAGFEELDKPLH